MIIKLSNFSDGIHQLVFDEPVATIGLNEPFIGNVHLDVKMDKSHSQVVLNGLLKLEARLVCDRCGEEYTTDLVNDFQVTYLFNKQPGEAEVLNLYYISPDTDKIDLINDVIDFAQLAIPMKNLCSEDCKGLCPKCGTNLNIGECKCAPDESESIWAPLKKLKKY